MSNKFSSLNEFLESLLDGREIQLKYDGKEYCIFNIGADNSVEKSKILVGEGNAEESFVEYSMASRSFRIVLELMENSSASSLVVVYSSRFSKYFSNSICLVVNICFSPHILFWCYFILITNDIPKRTDILKKQKYLSSFSMSYATPIFNSFLYQTFSLYVEIIRDSPIKSKPPA